MWCIPTRNEATPASASSPTGRRAGAAERGATFVEAALALPVVLLLFFAMMELSGALATYSGAASAVRSGGRMASIAGADPMSDRRTLARIAQESAGLDRGEIEVIVIWHASGPGDPVPPACLPEVRDTPNSTSLGVTDAGQGLVGACNVYVRPGAPGGAFAMARGELALPPEHYFGCQGDTDPARTHKVDCNWPGKNRRTVTTPRYSSGPVVPPDFVGVYLEVTHGLRTDLIRSSITITDVAIDLIEPHGYEFS